MSLKYVSEACIAFLASSCAASKAADKSDPATHEDVSTLAYDMEQAHDFAGKYAKGLLHMYGLEQRPTYAKIDPVDALATIDELNSLESFSPEGAEALRTHLKQPGALVYSFDLQASEGSAGLPHSVYFIPRPLPEGQTSAAPDASPGIVIVNMVRSDVKVGKTSNQADAVIEEPDYITRDKLDKLLKEEEKLLVVVGSECGAYSQFKRDSPLSGIEHHHIMYTDDETYWRELLGPQVLRFPAVVYFEDGQAIDAHYGYNKNSQPSLETFLARHGYNDKPRHYHTLDAAYVDSAFPSREAFAQWLVMNKTSLSGVVFDGVDLSGMLLSGCSFNGSILRDVNFDGADLRRCDFRCAKLEGTSLESAKTDNTTALPTSCD